METVDIQPKALAERNRQIEFALKLIRATGVKAAIKYCKENHLHGTLFYVQKMGSTTSNIL